jgi:TRAP-type C4-dicarboxylate transport system permease large subunit
MTAFKERFATVARSVLPFLGLMLVFLMIVTFVPALSMWLVD